MKRGLLALSLATMLIASAGLSATAQEEPKPKKDTVNQDTYAKPTFYYSTEDDKAAASSKKGDQQQLLLLFAVLSLWVPVWLSSF